MKGTLRDVESNMLYK